MTCLKAGIIITLSFMLCGAISEGKSEDLPPGISQEDWISLNDHCGIAIKEIGKNSGTTIGSIYLMKNGRWYKFVEEPVRPKVQLLHQ